MFDEGENLKLDLAYIKAHFLTLFLIENENFAASMQITNDVVKCMESIHSMYMCTFRENIKV